MIIDSHVHMGIDRDDFLITGKHIVSRMQDFGIDKSIVFSTRISNVQKVESYNDFVLNESSKYTEKLIPYYFFVPTKDSINYFLRTLSHWKGIKLYPNYRGFFLSPFSQEIIEIAHAYQKPLIIHTDTRDGVANEVLEALGSICDDLLIIFCHAFHLNQAMLQLVSLNSNWFVDMSPWIMMMRFPDSLLASKTERLETYTDNNDLFNFISLYNLVHSRIVWGSDLRDNSVHSYGAEIDFHNNLQSNIRKQILYNTMLFI